MASTRLPGKVLVPVAGRPVLQYLLERVARSTGIDEAIIATSVERDDDAIAAFCRTRRVPCVRGPLENVAVRREMADAPAPTPAHLWFAGAGRRQLLDLVHSRCFRERRIYDVGRVLSIIGEQEEIVQSPRPRERHMMFLWQLVNLELWPRELDSAARRRQPAVESVAGQLTAQS